MDSVLKVPLQKNYNHKMTDKDSIANVVSFTGLGAVMMEWHTILTIVLLSTGIILNIVRIRSAIKNKKD